MSLYPIPEMEAELEELALYKAGKGTLRFPLDERAPHGLIARVAAVLVEGRLQRASR